MKVSRPAGGKAGQGGTGQRHEEQEEGEDEREESHHRHPQENSQGHASEKRDHLLLPATTYNTHTHNTTCNTPYTHAIHTRVHHTHNRDTHIQHTPCNTHTTNMPYTLMHMHTGAHYSLMGSQGKSHTPELTLLAPHPLCSPEPWSPGPGPTSAARRGSTGAVLAEKRGPLPLLQPRGPDTAPELSQLAALTRRLHRPLGAKYRHQLPGPRHFSELTLCVPPAQSRGPGPASLTNARSRLSCVDAAHGNSPRPTHLNIYLPG